MDRLKSGARSEKTRPRDGSHNGQKAETLAHSAGGRLTRVGTKYGREPKIATEMLIKT